MDRSTGTERLQLLHKIDSGLDSNDVAALKFLCKDLVPQKHLERVHDGRDLFLRLEDQGLLEDDLMVGDLLYTIQRRDLLRLLGFNRDAMEQSLQDPRNSRISPYRKMLYNLSEDVTEDNLRTIKFLLKLPRGKLEPNASFLDVLVAMEKQELLREDSLEALEKVCTHCDKRLATKVREFAEHRAREETPGSGGHNLRVSRRESSVRSYTDSNPSPEDGSQLPPRSLQVTPNASVPEPSLSRTPVHHQLSVDAGTESIYEEAYDMSRRPRGHCIIINNHNFEASRKHPNRDGTDVDARALKEVFERMHFRVHPHRDLTQARLLSVLEEFGSMTHGELDAVCCVLSHGKKGFVYGTDGEPVSIRQLTQLFTSSRCPSLAGKPKLFFIQACQVQEPCIQSDGPGDTLYETDAVRPDTIPDDSDFLLGMATVEYQKAYRHNQNGSAFIQELCKQLKCGCPRKEDILAIMTKVNQKVSRISFGKFKQMPEPRYTLTKKVILTMD